MFHHSSLTFIIYPYIYTHIIGEFSLPGSDSHFMNASSTIKMYNCTLKTAFRIKRKQLGLTQEAKGALMCLSIETYIYIHIYIESLIYIYISTLCMYICNFINKRICLHIQMYLLMGGYLYICIYINTDIYTYMSVYINIYVYIYRSASDF